MDISQEQWAALVARGLLPASEWLREVDSTSDYIKRKLRAEEITRFPYLVAAHSQTAGRGRLQNRAFYSPAGGLYFSCACKASQVKCGVGRITLAAGVAVAKALEKFCGEPFALKWVNDVLCRGKKVCGILCESVSDTYIVGIGVNLRNDALTGFMPEKVGMLPTEVPRLALLCEIYGNLLAAFEDTSDTVLADYNARLSVRGRRVRVQTKAGTGFATVTGVCDEGLCCACDDGKEIAVRTCDEIVTDLYELGRNPPCD